MDILRTYEGVFIFQQTADDQDLEGKLEKVRSEITKAGGTVVDTSRMGRNTLERPIKKKESGFIVVITFTMDPANISALNERYKLKEDILRAQIMLAKKSQKTDDQNQKG